MEQPTGGAGTQRILLRSAEAWLSKTGARGEARNAFFTEQWEPLASQLHLRGKSETSVPDRLGDGYWSGQPNGGTRARIFQGGPLKSPVTGKREPKNPDVAGPNWRKLGNFQTGVGKVFPNGLW